MSVTAKFPPLETRGRVNFRKDFWEGRYNIGQYLAGAFQVMIPKTTAERISAPVPLSFLTWQIVVRYSFNLVISPSGSSRFPTRRQEERSISLYYFFEIEMQLLIPWNRWHLESQNG